MRCFRDTIKRGGCDRVTTGGRRGDTAQKQGLRRGLTKIRVSRLAGLALKIKKTKEMPRSSGGQKEQ
jgi:hypothetical protein